MQGSLEGPEVLISYKLLNIDSLLVIIWVLLLLLYSHTCSLGDSKDAKQPDPGFAIFYSDSFRGHLLRWTFWTFRRWKTMRLRYEEWEGIWYCFLFMRDKSRHHEEDCQSYLRKLWFIYNICSYVIICTSFWRGDRIGKEPPINDL